MRVRTSVTAAGLITVAALVLTGCGSDDDGGDTAKDKGKDTAPTAPAEKTDGADGGATDGELTGAWKGTTDGKSVDLVVTGTKAALVAAGDACAGEVADHGKPMLSLKCVGGKKDRVMGTIESNDGKTLVVAWDSGKKDTLAKAAAGAELPSGLPTGALDQLPKMP
ncbi:hypothetical protein [Streptomyces sp. NPDC020965]|uniref:hypothetical protein n=1 Tax=Streptomyces sp. NPDC020965 TaxID=3365105 RepID=UPI003788DBCB